MDKLNIVWCESSEPGIGEVTEFFSKDNDIRCIACKNIDEATAALGVPEVGAVILDMEFDRCVDLATSFKEKGSSVVLLSSGLGSGTESKISIVHDAYFHKPYLLPEIRTRLLKLIVQNIVSLKLNCEIKSIDERLSTIFIKAGIPPHIKGYLFLREAVKIAVAYPEMINSITKRLYPTIAQMHQTSASKVERAIRHAIEVAWNRGKIDNLNAIFGIKIYNKGEKPTNGELIALVADKMMIESM